MDCAVFFAGTRSCGTVAGGKFGNALSDISKKHGELVVAELASWDLGSKAVAPVYRRASCHLAKRTAGPEGKG